MCGTECGLCEVIYYRVLYISDTFLEKVSQTRDGIDQFVGSPSISFLQTRYTYVTKED
jgi:hypothetical protein